MNKVNSAVIGSDQAIYVSGIPYYVTNSYEILEIILMSHPRFRKISKDLAFTQISTSETHIIAISDKGELYGYGYNLCGQLGLGDQFTNTFTGKEMLFTRINVHIDRKVISVATGDQFSMVLCQDHYLWAFGLNNHGQLGLGDRRKRWTPTRNTILENIEQVSCGEFHTIVVDNSGNAWSFGYNGYGQLGKNEQYCSSHIECNNRNSCCIPHKIASGISAASCGRFHSLLLDNQLNVWSFGSNLHGQLAISNQTTTQSTTPNIIQSIKSVRKIQCGKEYSLITLTDGTVLCYGSIFSDDNVTLENNPNNCEISKQLEGLEIIPFANHLICFDNSNGDTFSIGLNSAGQLGTGDFKHRTSLCALPDLRHFRKKIFVKSARNCGVTNS